MFRIACIAAYKLSFNLCFSTASQPLLTPCLDLLKRIVKVPAAHVSKDVCGLYVEVLGSFDLQLAVCWHVASKQLRCGFRVLIQNKQAVKPNNNRLVCTRRQTQMSIWMEMDVLATRTCGCR